MSGDARRPYKMLNLTMKPLVQPKGEFQLQISEASTVDNLKMLAALRVLGVDIVAATERRSELRLAYEGRELKQANRQTLRDAGVRDNGLVIVMVRPGQAKKAGAAGSADVGSAPRVQTAAGSAAGSAAGIASPATTDSAALNSMKVDLAKAAHYFTQLNSGSSAKSCPEMKYAPLRSAGELSAWVVGTTEQIKIVPTLCSWIQRGDWDRAPLDATNDLNGWTALHYAAASSKYRNDESAKIVTALVAAGANLDAQSTKDFWYGAEFRVPAGSTALAVARLAEAEREFIAASAAANKRTRKQLLQQGSGLGLGSGAASIGGSNSGTGTAITSTSSANSTASGAVHPQGGIRGREVAFSGTLAGCTHDEAQRLAERVGATVASQVGATTDVLVCGKAVGQIAANKAAQFGVEVWSEDEFRTALQAKAAADSDTDNVNDGPGSGKKLRAS